MKLMDVVRALERAHRRGEIVVIPGWEGVVLVDPRAPNVSRILREIQAGRTVRIEPGVLEKYGEVMVYPSSAGAG